MANGAPVLEDEIIRVRSFTSVPGLGGEIYNRIMELRQPTLRAIGAPAVNQAVKGAAQARSLMSAHGEDLVLRPGMVTVKSEQGDDITAVIFHCLLSGMVTAHSITEEEMIIVRPETSVYELSAEVYEQLKKNGGATVRSIGPGAVNQAVKSVTKARQKLSLQGEDLIMRPGMVTVQNVRGDDVAAVIFHCLLG